MSWIGKLCETYDYAIRCNLGGSDKLMPLMHTSQNAHIHVIIDGNGNFKRAEVFKENIILPCTESSEGRTSGLCPHPLADKLCYVAKDLSDNSDSFKLYIEQLKSWNNSEYRHPKVDAVYKYICKGTCVRDLLTYGVLYSKDGKNLFSPTREMLEKEFLNADTPKIFQVIPKNTKSKKYEQEVALICWSVEIEGDPLSHTWEDKSIQESWIQYASEMKTAQGLCFIEGINTSLALNHASKIRHPGDKAKLISSNDKDGFTFRGRFADSKKSEKNSGLQGMGVGLIVSQKAHNALRWLCQRQGYRNDEQVIVAWAVSGKSIPNPLKDSWSLLQEEPQLNELLEDEEINEDIHTIDHGRDLGQTFAVKLNKYMAGYRVSLSDYENIIIMAIDSATPGRMSITYYRECFSKGFIERVTNWHLQFSWLQLVDEKKKKWFVNAPSPLAIANAAYGTHLSDSLKKNLFERIIPCIIEGQTFPIDIVNACVRRACNSNSIEKKEWDKIVGIACALYRGFFNRHPILKKRRDFSMSLELDNRSRDYLYGRLLAIAENIEQFALREADENRLTTAERLMQRFADRPFSTWRNIELMLQPYIQRLQRTKGGFVVNRKKLIDSVVEMFEGNDFTNEKALSGEFLLGYHCQRADLLRNKKEENSNND